MGFVNSQNVAFCLSVLLLTAVFVPRGSMSQSPSTDPPRAPEGFDLQGHRGARGLAPENTIPAFRTALRLGVTTLEMDVVLSGDDRVVVSHEPWMAHEKCRTPDGESIPESAEDDHVIYDMTYDEVAKYDCGSTTLADFPEQEPTPAPKPPLDQVLEMAESYVEETSRPPVFYNIEIKSRPDWEERYQPAPGPFTERVLETVRSAGVDARTTIQSFDPRILEVVRERDTTVRTALLIGAEYDQGVAENLKMLSFVPDIYSPSVRLVDQSAVEAVHERGMTLIPWTVNDPSTMRELLRLGVDGFITDYPDRGQEVLDSWRENSETSPE